MIPNSQKTHFEASKITDVFAGVAENLGVEKVTVIKLWKKYGFYCYKYFVTQEIFPEDNIRRMEFCETLMKNANQNVDVFQNICFADRSTFPLHSKHNPSVLYYWS